MAVERKRNDNGSKKGQLAPLMRSVNVVPDSFNASDNTIELIAATEAEVMQVGWNGVFSEVLSMDPSNIRLDRLNNSANVLDNHNSYGSVRQAVVGVVEKAWIEKKQLHVKMRFSNREDVKPLIQDVKDGIIKNISVRYRVYTYEITEEIGKTPIYTAIDWEPSEVSFVSVPADYMAGVRNNNNSSQQNEVEVKYTKNVRTVSTRNEGGASPAENASTVTTTAAPAPAKPAAPAATPTPEEGERSLSKIERQRSAEIFKAVRAANLPAEFAEQLITDEKMTLDLARAAILDKLAESLSPAQTRGANAGVNVKTDEADKRRTGMRNAILVRSGIEAIKEDGKEVRLNAGEFRGMTLMDMGRECLEIANVKTRGMSQREVAAHALGIGDNTRALSSSDFPIILGNTVNRSLRSAYDLAEKSFLPFCRRGTFKDFRSKTVAQLGDLNTVDAIEEGGEYKYGNIGDAGETYKAVKYGKIIPITWETLVNDDLDAFSRIPQTLANACAQKQSDLVYNILNGNPVMADTFNVFDATNHGNLAGAGAVISLATLGAARAAQRKQKSPGGSYLNLTGRYLVVGPDQEQAALQFLSSAYVATKSSDINPYRGTMDPIVEGRLSGSTAWYVIADPAKIDTIEYSFLDGEEIFTEQRIGFDVDGMQMKVRMVFAAKAIEYRGLYKNPGA